MLLLIETAYVYAVFPMLVIVIEERVIVCEVITKNPVKQYIHWMSLKVTPFNVKLGAW